MRKLILIAIFAILGLALLAQTTDVEEKKKKKNEKEKEKLELREEKKFNKEQKKQDKQDRPKEIKTLMGNVDSHGGYAGLGINYSEIDKLQAIAFNIRGSWVIGHAFAFGIGGTGFFSESQPNDSNIITSYQGGYGGFYFEPIILPRFPVHISLPIFLGVGGITETGRNATINDYETAFYDATSFLIIEPGVELELNFFKHLRIAFGATYRYPTTMNFSNTEIQTSDLEGITMGVTFKLGKF